jgi:hypothetical protein
MFDATPHCQRKSEMRNYFTKVHCNALVAENERRDSAPSNESYDLGFPSTIHERFQGIVWETHLDRSQEMVKEVVSSVLHKQKMSTTIRKISSMTATITDERLKNFGIEV